MAPRSKSQGHNIVYVDAAWVYADTGDPVAGTQRECGHCGHILGDFPDPCLGELPGVMSACCGHGEQRESYIQFGNGVRVSGFKIEQGVSMTLTGMYRDAMKRRDARAAEVSSDGGSAALDSDAMFFQGKMIAYRDAYKLLTGRDGLHIVASGEQDDEPRIITQQNG